MGQKTNCMKLLIIGILSNIIITSCGEDDIEKIEIHSYTYTNASAHSLSIIKWNNGDIDTFDLIQSQKIEFIYKFNGTGCSIDGTNMPDKLPQDCLLITSDSLKIIFDDGKSILLRPNEPRDINILIETNFEKISEGNKKLYNYRFSEKDYLEAY